jgi:hypothetical protein
MPVNESFRQEQANPHSRIRHPHASQARSLDDNPNKLIRIVPTLKKAEVMQGEFVIDMVQV